MEGRIVCLAVARVQLRRVLLAPRARPARHELRRELRVGTIRRVEVDRALHLRLALGESLEADEESAGGAVDLKAAVQLLHRYAVQAEGAQASLRRAAALWRSAT